MNLFRRIWTCNPSEVQHWRNNASNRWAAPWMIATNGIDYAVANRSKRCMWLMWLVTRLARWCTRSPISQRLSVSFDSPSPKQFCNCMIFEASNSNLNVRRAYRGWGDPSCCYAGLWIPECHRMWAIADIDPLTNLFSQTKSKVVTTVVRANGWGT